MLLRKTRAQGIPGKVPMTPHQRSNINESPGAEERTFIHAGRVPASPSVGILSKSELSILSPGCLASQGHWALGMPFMPPSSGPTKKSSISQVWSHHTCHSGKDQGRRPETLSPQPLQP